jgi:hypothetical protein
MAGRARTPASPLIAAAACAALALASLALPSGPTYDPYAWLIWGREIAHLDLVTSSGGASWKPLPALIDALLAPLGGGAPSAWLVVARAGALFAVFMAFSLAWRLAGPGTRALAGLVAAVSLAFTHEWVRDNGIGYAEGLMSAFGLLAIARHLDGRRGQAFALLVAAGLIRVEVWPFVFAYAAWLWFKGNRPRRSVLIAGALLIALLWFGGAWLGSGSLTASAGNALHRVPGTAGASPHPAVVVAREAYHMLPLPAWLGVAAAVALGIARERKLLVVAGAAATWTVLVAVMAEHGYAGLPRFLFMANALEAVLAGVGAAVIAEAAARAVAGFGIREAKAVAAAGIVVVFAFAAAPDAALLPAEGAAIDRAADSDTQLAVVVDRLGGGKAVFRCGRPTTPWYMVTALAWDLGVGVRHVHDRRVGSGAVVFVQGHQGWRVHMWCPRTSSPGRRRPSTP